MKILEIHEIHESPRKMKVGKRKQPPLQFINSFINFGFSLIICYFYLLIQISDT